MTLEETAREVVPALRRIANELKIGPNGEGLDLINTLITCAADLEWALIPADPE